VFHRVSVTEQGLNKWKLLSCQVTAEEMIKMTSPILKTFHETLILTKNLPIHIDALGLEE